MPEIQIGRHGAIFLALLFVILTAEDILIWIRSGAVPALEFFIALLLVLGVVALAIREANLHPPPGE